MLNMRTPPSASPSPTNTFSSQQSAQATPPADRVVVTTMSLEWPTASCGRGDFLSRAGRTVAGVGLAGGVVVPRRAEAKKAEPEVREREACATVYGTALP